MPECGDITTAASILYENYVKEKYYSIVDRLSRVPSKLAIIEVLYDAIRGIRDDSERTQFSEFIKSIERLKDSDAIYCAKLLALKALSGE
jgi:hypothetical protein